jgi:citrate lyase subunit beta / citryl-CoA lyase
MNNRAEAGIKGPEVRSDCWVELIIRDSGGISINLKSKVESLYGKSIVKLADQVIRFYKIEHAEVIIEDSGALPPVIAARIETAVKRLKPDEKTEFLLPSREGIRQPSVKDRLRRSRLYLPGNDAKLSINAGLHKPDAVILDLEDSVAPAEKDAARFMVRNTLRETDFYGAERMVRINQLPLGLKDLEAVIPQAPNMILVPKVESAAQVMEVEHKIAAIKQDAGVSWEVFLMPIIESALGAWKALEIATASPLVAALAIGLEDYTADIGAQRTLEGKESLWMRGAVLNAARAAGVQPIDTVFSDVSDMDGLRESVLEAKSLGFDGKGCIHPRQIQVVHDAFAPTEMEIDKATKIVGAFEEAQAKGSGVVSLGSKMIDAPVVKRAQNTIRIAILSGLLNENWMEEVDNG